MSTFTDCRYLHTRRKQDAFFAGLKKLIKAAGVKVPARCWRIQLMAQPKGLAAGPRRVLPHLRRRERAIVTGDVLEAFIDAEMKARGFTREGGYWLLGYFELSYRHRKVRLWLEGLEPDAARRKLKDEIDTIIERRCAS